MSKNAGNPTGIYIIVDVNMLTILHIAIKGQFHSVLIMYNMERKWTKFASKKFNFFSKKVLTFSGNGVIILTVNEARTKASAPGGIYKQEIRMEKPTINPRES